MNLTKGLVLSSRIYTGSATPPALLEDQSRFKNNGVYTNITQTRLPSGLWVNSFNGATSYVNCGANSSLNFTSQLFSLSGWIKLDVSYSGAASLMCKGDALSRGYIFTMGFGTALCFTFATSQAGVWQVSSTSAILVNTWYQFVVARTSTANVNMYINGLDATIAHGVHINPTSCGDALVIGARSDGATNPLKGQMALPRIWNRVFSATEIYKLFQAERRFFNV